MLDFIIVGKGLAANILALRFKEHHISYNIIGNSSLSNCSHVAAGLWNPVVFKRMTLSWKAQELIDELKQFYSIAEQTLDAAFYNERIIIKPFFSPEEKEQWIKRSKGELSAFVDTNIFEVQEKNNDLVMQTHYGIVKDCGNIDVVEFLNSCDKLQQEHTTNETFDHSQLSIQSDHVTYKNLKAKNIIFCEGHLIKNNPYFNWLPMNPVKGDVFDIEAELSLDTEILNHNAFIFRTGNKQFKMGSTYNWNDLTENATDGGANELKEKLKGLIKVPYTIIEHRAGIRPSTLDRRPIIGAHPQYKNLFVFNGLGTKGVMLAPYLSKNFVYFYLNKGKLDTDIHIKRYYPKFNG